MVWPREVRGSVLVPAKRTEGLGRADVRGVGVARVGPGQARMIIVSSMGLTPAGPAGPPRPPGQGKPPRQAQPGSNKVVDIVAIAVARNCNPKSSQPFCKFTHLRRCGRCCRAAFTLSARNVAAWTRQPGKRATTVVTVRGNAQTRTARVQTTMTRACNNNGNTQAFDARRHTPDNRCLSPDAWHQTPDT